jgi:hypothetical protein
MTHSYSAELTESQLYVQNFMASLTPTPTPIQAIPKADYTAPLVNGVKQTFSGFTSFIPPIDLPNWFFPTIGLILGSYVLFFIYVNFLK